MNTGKEVHEGLEGIVVTATAIGHVDGEKGQLVVRGRDIEVLAETCTYEDACVLLWATPENARSLQTDLGIARRDAWERVTRLGDALALPDAMEALRAALAHVPSVNDARDSVALAASAAVYVAAWSRMQRGLEPVAPDASLTHAADFLRMVNGQVPGAALVRGLDSYWVTVADHGMNASTFTARVVASTGSDMVSSIVAAVGALKGPLHGGAPGPVLDMLDAIASPARAEAWIEEALARGERIMGMGHRIYRVRDPRAEVLERAVEALATAGVRTDRLDLARAVERAATGVLSQRHPTRALKANVEFYTAVLLDTLGLARSSFSAVFAIGRIVGWAAHVIEQRTKKRIIRPDSRYTGHLPG
ncbi:MAG: citrate synthase [Sandaracinaceae bacterium]|nr:citrate synthase [Sandaracinaceae bacterium]